MTNPFYNIKDAGCHVVIYNNDVMKVNPNPLIPKAHYLLSDPPYGIGMQKQSWDTDIAMRAETWKHLKGFLQPGAMTSVYSQPRTCIKIGGAMESAGFETSNTLGWLHLSGFCSPARVSPKEDETHAYWNYRYGSDSLRPVFEPVIVSQNPFNKRGKKLDQILENNTGIYNVEESRLPNGKHPTNLIATHHPDCHETGCSPHCPSKAIVGKDGDDYFPVFNWHYNELETLYYAKKPSRWEKEAGLDEFDFSIMERMNKGGFSKDPKFASKQRKNPHRTVKPIQGNKYLAKMFLPPNPENLYILIPFCGTGSEIVGAILAGWRNIIAIEIDPLYAEIAAARTRFWLTMLKKGWDSVDSVVKHIKQIERGGIPQSALF